MTRFTPFDRRELQLKGLTLRESALRHEQCKPLHAPDHLVSSASLSNLCHCISRQENRSSASLFFTGGHPIKLGLSRYLINLIERGFITHFATNGAGLIHDFELALAGETSEDVHRWIQAGQFGLWQETSRLNDIIREAAHREEGLGEAVGRTIEEECFPHHDLSIAAACWRQGIPCTCHVSIGSDIIHAMPNCDGAALGQTSYTDFLIFAQTVSQLEGGVFVNIGSAVTGPEVFLKALSMARNIAHQHDQRIEQFTTAVFDLIPLPENYRDGPPSKDDPLYYFRPWKTLLCRTVTGGQSYYICGDHRQTIPTLWHHLV
jgi:hypothetical protein